MNIRPPCLRVERNQRPKSKVLFIPSSEAVAISLLSIISIEVIVIQCQFCSLCSWPRDKFKNAIGQS